MDLSFVFLMVMGFLTCGLVAGLIQTITILVTYRQRRKQSLTRTR